MRLKQLTIGNFGLYSEPMTVNWPDRGLILVTAQNHDSPSMGANACGKSTLAEAIGWLFYGRTARGVRGRTPTHWGSDGDPDVVLDTGKEKITRLFGPERLSIDGIDIDSGEEWLGLTPDEFATAVCIPQAFRSFIDMTPAQRMALLSPSLNLERWDAAAAVAKKEAYDRRARWQWLSRAVDRHAAAKGEVERQLELAKPSTKQFLSESDRCREVIRIAGEIEAAAEALAKKYEDRAVLASGKVEAWTVRASELDEKIIDLRTDLRSKEQEIIAIESDIKANKEKTGKIRKGEGDCPVCRRPWLRPDRHRLVQAMRDDRDLQQASLKHATLRRDLLAKRLKNTETKRANYTAKAAAAVSRVDEHRLKARQAARRASKAAGDRREAETMLGSAEAEERRTSDLRARHEELGYRLVQAGSLARGARLDTQSAETWQGHFGRLKLWAANAALASLSQHATGLLGRLGMPGWRLEFASSRQGARTEIAGLVASVYMPGDDTPVSENAWSGGERQRLRVVTADAISQFILAQREVDIRFEIWDEPLSALSTEGVASLLSYLKEKAADKLVVVIDHRVEHADAFDATLTIHREDDGIRAVEWS